MLRVRPESLGRNPATGEILTIQQEAVDVVAAIKKLVATDADLMQYPEVLSLLDTINVLDFALDISDANADNIEVTIVELGLKETHRLEYLYMYNCNYVEEHLALNWQNKNVNVFTTEDYSFDFSKEDIKSICDLASELGLENLTLKAFAKFLIYLLSRFVQKDFYDSSAHGIYRRLDPEKLAELDRPNEFLTKHFAKAPIKELPL